MSDEPDDPFSAIEVDADNYATTSATDTPTVSRTHQSEATFQAIKATYSAKIDNGTTYADLLAALPVLAHPSPSPPSQTDATPNGEAKVKLTKKDFQLIGYAVGELYYDGDFAGVVELCERVRGRCEVEGRVGESLERWVERCRGRLGGGG